MKKYIEKLKKTLDRIEEDRINDLVKRIIKTFDDGGTVYTCGNGGSGSTASHFAGDIMKTLGIKTCCFNDNMTGFSALGNDVHYNKVFSEQVVKRQVFSPDILICFSGSGESQNIIEAIEEADDCINKPWAIIGFSGNRLKELNCEILHIPVNDMEIYEDCSLAVCHVIKRKLQQKFEDKERNNF
jgi:D-sedoheptulose 7-phosphate isomerase